MIQLPTLEKNGSPPVANKDVPKMKALVYYGAGKKAWEEKPKPSLPEPSDALVRISKTTMGSFARLISASKKLLSFL